MKISMYTNAISMTSTRSLGKATDALSVAMQRLGTGKRINSAADDAAGLQIATRLQSQSNGMTVAKHNIARSSAMMSLGEGALEEVTNVLQRMKELSTQAADDSFSAEDRSAMQSEYDALFSEMDSIMRNTRYGSEPLLQSVIPPEVKGKFTSTVQFQIGSSSEEVLKVNLDTKLQDSVDAMLNLVTVPGNPGALEDSFTANDNIDMVSEALEKVQSVRSEFGSNINRLQYTDANLSNMRDNTDINIGTIVDADYAMEVTKMTRMNMLMQSSQAMLNQGNGIARMALNLLG